MKHIIWSSDINYDDWKEYMDEEYPELNEDEKYYLARDINDDYLEDEKMNLDKELNQPLLICASLGLWNGRRQAYKFLKDTNLNGIFTGTCGDYVTWFVEDGEVKCSDSHHDGTNYYTYRVLKPEYTEEDFDEFSFDYTIDKAVEKMTNPLGDIVSKVYGWENVHENV